MIIENPKDRRIADWLQTQRTDEEIALAVTTVTARGQRAYTSHVVKQLGLRVPDDVFKMPQVEIDAAKLKLQALRDEFKAKAEAANKA